MVPIYREHAMKGVLEVFFKEPHIFSEPEVRTYQLMATLAGDASALPVVAAEKRAASSSTLARALLRMNQQVRQLSVTRQPAPEAPAQERSEPVHAKIISAVRNWDARTYGAQLAASAAKNLGRLRLPKWQLPRLALPRLSWNKTAVDRLRRDLHLLQAQWPAKLRGRLILNAAAVSVVLVLAIMAAIARHQSISPVAASSASRTTAAPAQAVPAVEQQIIAPPSLKPNATLRDAGAPTSSFKRVWAGKDEVDYIADDVTIRHFRPLPTPEKSSLWSKQVKIGKDVTVRYFNGPPVPTVQPAAQQAVDQAVKD